MSKTFVCRGASVCFALAAGLLSAATAGAHHPNWEAMPVLPRIDVIPPLGNRLPLSYAARYNRPHPITGRIMYWIEPSSQEAMAWHRAAHRGYYRNHAPRMETRYFYPKPWEVLGVGARPKPETDETRPAPPGAKVSPGAPMYKGQAFDGREAREIELAPPIELVPVPESGR